MISVVMTTYAPAGEGSVRAEYALWCASALRECLRTKRKLHIHLADDGSSDQAYLRKIGDDWRSWSFTDAKRRGIGTSLNKALDYLFKHTDTKYWLYTTDDWWLTAALDLDKAVAILDQGYDLVRLGPIHPNLRCFSRFNANVGWWLELEASYGGFAFATRPFLATRRFSEHYGPYPEGLNAYETERLYSVHVAQLSSEALAPRLAALPDIVGPWEHIGEYEVGTCQLA